MAKLSNTATALLKTIVDAGDNGTHAEATRLAVLEKAGYVEVNREKIDDNGHFGVHATKAGIEAASKSTDSKPTTKAAPAKTATSKPTTKAAPAKTATSKPTAADSAVSPIKQGIPVPKNARGQRRSKYPQIDELEIGGSFFVAAGDDLDATAKAVGGVVHNANRRHSVLTGNTTTVKLGKNAGREAPERQPVRLFTYRRVSDGADWDMPGVSGVAVFRIEVE